MHKRASGIFKNSSLRLLLMGGHGGPPLQRVLQRLGTSLCCVFCKGNPLWLALPVDKVALFRLVPAVFIGAVFLASSAFADGTLQKHCADALKTTGQCPQDICQADCLLGIRYESCPLTCVPKLCFEIEPDSCPADYCQTVQGCSGEEVCYHKDSPLQGECGEEGYGGPLDCCSGLKKVCGVKTFEGTCDTNAESSAFSVPMCLPCGDGICGHMESSCNCPKDCGR